MIGSTISHYKILEKLGEGGMGVVYKAQDTKLDRLVALKFLPERLNTSDQDKARFIQEAKAASALNHPNVCTIHAIEEHEGQLFIAMEFVDGQTLRDKRGSVTFKQAIDVGIQIADGLTAAHEKGIVHRDIKPENIMVRKDGICQIMDFGLAKLRSSGSKITRLTKEGSTVGTAGYMSPEQVQGHDTDHRSDIFSYGVLLYELLTGQLPFRGVHETALAYEIVNVDAAPMSSVKPDIDPNLDAIVLECLEKDPRERTQSIAQTSVDLKRYRRESTRQRASRVTATRPAYSSSQSSIQPSEGLESSKSVPKSSSLSWILTALFFLIAVGAILFHVVTTPVPEPRRMTRAVILPPSGVDFNVRVGGLVISPDGLKIAFAGRDTSGTNLLWVRPVESLTAVPLVGTNGANYPFWSPDGKSLAFFAGGRLKKIDATGGPVVTICDAEDGRGGTWNSDGIIVFAPSNTGALSKVSAAGGLPVAVTTLDTTRNIRNHRWPHFLPDGNHFIYSTQSSPLGNDNDEIRIARLPDEKASPGTVADSVLLHGDSNTEYASGYLLFHRQGILMARPFDIATFQLTGEAVPIAEQLQYHNSRSKATFSVSKNSILVYQTDEEQQGKFALFDRAGNRLSLLDTKNPAGGKFSHDGKRIAYEFFDTRNRQSDIWIYDIHGGHNFRLTYEVSNESAPCWSPHDDSIVFSSNRNGRTDLYIKNANGTGTERLLVGADNQKFATDWSSDGKHLVYHTLGHLITKADLWLLPMSGDRTPVPLLQTELSDAYPYFSPDGKWIAYDSQESGRLNIFVLAADGTGGKQAISVKGGNTPIWSRDGKTIFFRASGRVMAAAVRVVQSSVVVDSIQTLFDFESRGISGGIQDVSADGQKFLAIVTESRQSSMPITLVVNWDEELKKK